jgi:trk system potassium uptake protein TrkA
MHIIIAGEGRLPYFLVKSFIAKGYRVTAIISNLSEAEDLARRTKATIIIGNASDPEVLRKGDAYYCDLLVAVTPLDEDNLIISQLAKMEFGISKTLALVNDPDNTEIFQKLGCKAFSTTELISGMIEQSVQTDDIISMIPTEEGKILLTEFKLSPACPILNTPLRDVDRPKNSLLVSIVRKDDVIVPNGDTVLQAGDKILVLSTPDNHSKVIRMITGTEV